MNFKIDTVNKLKGEVKAKALDRLQCRFGASPFSFLSPIKKGKFLKVVKQHLDTLWAKTNEETFKLKNSLYWGKHSLNFQNP